MGDEPPDDPGGTVPSVGLNIEISSLEASAVDTEDGARSEDGRKNRKRIKTSRRHSEKKRKDSKGNFVESSHDDITEYNANIKYTEFVSSLSQDKLTNVTVSNKPSTQIPPTQPRYQNIRKYERTDISPYVIHVVRQSAPEERASLHPVQFGNILKKNSVPNIVNGSLKRIGRNRLALAFTHFDDANNFIDNPCLETHKLKAFIPTFTVTRMGIVRGVPASWSEEEILDNVSVPIGCGKIIK
ncbi:uncharacterized protein LOC113238101, partial [Hyposmocoma kahamanoa]|uniref:uncharacterized protein LOC113238101 n=1 Tax=Hyposmocoma kahamanoa TaxID=1477025 RepID=UPI000E6DA194